jgi:glycosyltransferase involved in cell wall biosynthesis
MGTRLGSLGAVAIGRNEGERLVRCLASFPQSISHIIYVDSGSTDRSVEHARRRGAEVVELDMSVPFTAARARNAGIARLRDTAPTTEFVLVLDGDCELVPGFVEAALETMEREPKTAVVCGRRRERYRDASIYNRLCDMEWDTPVGVADACGGDAVIRLAAIGEVGGYDDSIIAGEEPELCFRLRQKGWIIRRIDHDMTLHDAAMTRFDQWWKRSVRAGHAYAEGYARHRYWGREVRSALVYGAVIPPVAIAGGFVTAGLGLCLFAAHGALFARVRGHRLAHGDSAGDASLYAKYCVLSKFAHTVGMSKYLKNRLSGERPHIIEYKSPADGDSDRAANTVSP